jgi:16S rRNA (cytosine1402-N4)-methyltransferase
MKKKHRSTAPGEHRAVLVDAVLRVLDPQPADTVVDCTIGFAGHAVELLRRIGPGGRLIGLDLDPQNIERARPRLEAVGHPFTLHHANFAGLDTILAREGLSGADAMLADLGMSSMQVDDPERGFSYSRDGPLDMRMDPTRGKSAAQVLLEIGETDLARALAELGDEPEAARIARLIVEARARQPLQRTGELARLLVEASGQRSWRLHPRPGAWNLHPAARTFQALRLLVNRELDNLRALLRVLPACLKPGGRAAIISFHSGEDRLVKSAFKEGLNAGQYDEIAGEPLRAAFAERTANPRSRSAKLRWARTKSSDKT